MRKRTQHTRSNLIPNLLYNQRSKEIAKIYTSTSDYTSAFARVSTYVEVCKAGVYSICMLAEALGE